MHPNLHKIKKILIPVCLVAEIAASRHAHAVKIDNLWKVWWRYRQNLYVRRNYIPPTSPVYLLIFLWGTIYNAVSSLHTGHTAGKSRTNVVNVGSVSLRRARWCTTSAGTRVRNPTSATHVAWPLLSPVPSSHTPGSTQVRQQSCKPQDKNLSAGANIHVSMPFYTFL